MIFQEWIRECLGARPADAVKLIEQQTGLALSYQRAYRWYRKPSAMPLDVARAVVKASAGKCTLDELVDMKLIAARFAYDSDVATERRYVEQRLAELERELRQLEQLQARPIEEVRADIKRVRARLQRLDATPVEPRKPGRPRTRDAKSGKRQARAPRAAAA